MNGVINFTEIVEQAWCDYDSSRPIKYIEDISAKVSTNHVYRIWFEDESPIIAKLSYFGKYEHFKQDHTIINALATNLSDPFENFLAKSLTKRGELYTYKYDHGLLKAWVVFYNPIRVGIKPRRIQSKKKIEVLGQQLAKFHKACHKVRNTLPANSKSIAHDTNHLLEILKTDHGKYEHRQHIDSIERQCHTLLDNINKLGMDSYDAIPVFVDWNIGNFSVDGDFHFFSRWDYDWFRMSSRVMDFYFFSRVCSAAGDRTIFSYTIDPLMEPRFAIFLKAYHEVYPLTFPEIAFMKEAYRFFILNYVIKDGRYFFNEIYASRLQLEAHEIYFPNLERSFDEEAFVRLLNL
jgi:hypothetical protein